ncbi:MAG: hypothetical protein J6K42_07985 [Clostridia bacterium]|nr:hypothetical protein [Clostridia bacterium]
MSLYSKLAENQTLVKLVENYREKKKAKNKKKRVKGTYKFVNRKKDYNKMCIILAGYKPYLWDDIFERISKYIPKDIDVCIVSSGLYSEELSEIAKKNDWSYLSVKQNKVSLVQNIAINLFDKAELIYKLDEDIFVTKNMFTKMLETYKEVENNSTYRVGFVAPLLPINGYAHIKVLQKTGLLNAYEKKFGRAQYNWNPKGKVVINPDIAKFMWGETEEKLRDIDKLDDEFARQNLKYSICAIRFSIGAILFSRELWENMGRFEVRMGNNMGLDEMQICNYVFADSRAIIVSENTIAGHFSYGPQNKVMKEFYKNNREIFKFKK